jgi:RimJ/RimL family protein N-acetyltransferase
VTELRTRRLLLRQWRAADLDPYARLCADPEVMRYLGGKPYSRRQSGEQLESFVQHWSDHGFGLWAVELWGSGELIGFVGLSTHSWWPGVEVGWRLDPAHWNRGLATEGAAASLDYGFGTLGLDRVISIAHRDNIASRRVMEKNGLTFEQEATLPHSGAEVVILGIDRADWRAGRRPDDRR